MPIQPFRRSITPRDPLVLIDSDERLGNLIQHPYQRTRFTFVVAQCRDIDSSDDPVRVSVLAPAGRLSGTKERVYFTVFAYPCGFKAAPRSNSFVTMESRSRLVVKMLRSQRPDESPKKFIAGVAGELFQRLVDVNDLPVIVDQRNHCHGGVQQGVEDRGIRNGKGIRQDAAVDGIRAVYGRYHLASCPTLPVRAFEPGNGLLFRGDN